MGFGPSARRNTARREKVRRRERQNRTQARGAPISEVRPAPERMRIAIVYDCLFPNTVGGAERWYRDLAERLGGRHSVTYLTRRQWEGDDTGAPFPVIAVAPGGPLYTERGRRRIGPPLRFGLGVFLHLLRHAGRYDAVHCASFPYFSLLGAALALRLRRRGPLVV